MKSLIAAFIALLICTGAFAQKIEKGVSKELATFRSELISNIQYRLDFNIPVNKEQDIESLLELEFDLSKLPQVLQLDFKEDKSKLKSLWVNGQQTPIIFENEHILLFGKNLKKTANRIKIAFIAGNGSLNRNKEYLYALFVPANARTAFPCFDQPDLKARFELSLTVPKGWKVLANGKLKDSLTQNSTVRYQFTNSDKISTYLFSFCSGKFDQAKRMGKQPMELLYRENDPQKISLSVDSIFKLHTDALDFLTSWTAIPYPFQKIGFAAIPDFQFGGMEHPGVVLYKSSSLFLDDGAIKDQYISRANLISHETAHMWFGDLVTMKWFNDVWMKEVFANFMADKVAEKMMGEQAFNLKFLQDHFPAAYGVDRTLGANPIRQKLNNLQDAGSMYGNIIYHKAPIMMRQLEALMGPVDFQKGIREYLAKYANKNADWPELITILARHTTADLYAWNKVWVNLPGRPIFSYDVKYQGNRISNFSISQRPEQGEPRLWPQVFTLNLVYPGRTTTVTVNMKDAKLDLPSLNGTEKPLYYFFNANGMGYGLFPVDNAMLQAVNLLAEPVERASVYINLYENTLAGKYLKPLEAIDFYVKMLGLEKNELNLKLLTGYLSNLYWNFIKEQDRNAIHQELEKSIWNMMGQQQANGKKILFNAYQNLYLSNQASERMVAIWEKKTPPEGIKLTEDDYISLAVSIALRANSPTTIIAQQIERTLNNDRKERLAFLAPSLATDPAERAAFFYSLREKANRKKEAWVTAGLSYLHHPLRQRQSQAYLEESLLLLEQIKQTGDIFFPQSWLAAVFGSYQSEYAYQVVQNFLKTHPNYNPMLKDKILQATDNLRRAQKLN
ncbi:M1 family aminopeptidase [Pedobacter sp. Hv1]|uniref:M1 family metallopeptidase n=1 Tax=Pedobacter sp. Hv1 TaxID=1740090 RepID=UPI0006D8AB32|nr:M1 family aminopeptidase [Pedobacter sp. Hv1]KQC00084.1 aminopeptidase [Pedobacter sp. Hv1]